VAPDQLAEYRQAAQLVLTESAGGRIWPRHVDQAVRKQEAAGASVVFLAMTHKVGDALLQYQTETSPEPKPAPAPAVVRAEPAVAAAVQPAQAEPGFAPPSADINSPFTAVPGAADYSDASRAIGNYINAIWVRVGGIVVLAVAAFMMASSLNLDGLKTVMTFAAVFAVIITGWQIWALISFASHAPPNSDAKGTAQTAAVFTGLAGLIDVLAAFASEPALGSGRSTNGWNLLSGLLALVSILLVVSCCRKVANAFGDGRLEMRGRTVNTIVGLCIGDFVLMFLMGMAGAGALILLLMLAFFGLFIAGIVYYMIMLYGTKRALAYGRS
jgi:hypothetical protein